MAKQASKTVIGVFVVSSIAMLIAGVIVFGSGDIFKKELKYVMFFEDLGQRSQCGCSGDLARRDGWDTSAASF